MVVVEKEIQISNGKEKKKERDPMTTSDCGDACAIDPFRAEALAASCFTGTWSASLSLCYFVAIVFSLSLACLFTLYRIFVRLHLSSSSPLDRSASQCVKRWEGFPPFHSPVTLLVVGLFSVF